MIQQLIELGQKVSGIGRTNVALFAEAVAGAASETLITLSQSKQFAAVTTGTSYNVAVGKTFRVKAISASWVSTTTTANTSRIRIRVNPTGAAIISSPIAYSQRLAWGSVTFVVNEGISLALPVDFDVPGGGGLAVTHTEVAANGTLDVALLGYEFTP